MRRKTDGKTKIIWVRLDLEDYEHLLARAKETGLYISTLARKYIKEGLLRDRSEVKR